MKIKLPKDLRGVQNHQVLPFELNDFDIDLFLPALFYKVVAEGHDRLRNVNDATAINAYIDALARHPLLVNFDSDAGRRVLARLVRTSLVVTGKVGRARAGEQILSVAPYSLLAHKAILPNQSRRQRNVDTFLYSALLEVVGGPAQGAEHLKQHFAAVFGHGLTLGAKPEYGGKYDGVTSLDTLTRLSLAFLDGFHNTPAGKKKERGVRQAFPTLTDELAQDIYRYLSGFHDSMPSQALTYHLQALINFELFLYTLKVVHAVNKLVQDPLTLPTIMTDAGVPTPPEIYVDFTGVAGNLSQEMAKAGVRRDVEAYQAFFTSTMLLRQLNRYADNLGRSRKAQIDTYLLDREGAAYLQGLLQLREDARLGLAIEAAAQLDETRIRDENCDDEEETDSETNALIARQLDAVVEHAASDLDRVVALLVESQRSKTLNKYVRWFWGVGGISKPHGLLRGVSSNRNSWRYAASNDLLVVWVQLAVARARHTAGGKPAASGIGLPDFLKFLEVRFGILVDRPPRAFTGPEYTAAARENLRAMLLRLRQMGIFRDLSDDFTVQRLDPLYPWKKYR